MVHLLSTRCDYQQSSLVVDDRLKIYLGWEELDDSEMIPSVHVSSCMDCHFIALDWSPQELLARLILKISDDNDNNSIFKL
jgi:hypothetical protein